MPKTAWLGAAVAGLAAATLATVAPASAQPSDIDARATVAGTVPSWATPPSRAGEADDQAVRHIQVALSLRDPDSAHALATRLASPNNPKRGDFLTSRQFLDRFAPTETTVNAVRDWLTGQGVSVEEVSDNRFMIKAHAPTSVLEKAFGTQLAIYRDRVAGRIATLVAPEAPISVPTALRTSITAVLGLDDSEKTIRPQHTVPHASAQAQTCARWWGEQNNRDVPQKYPAGAQSNFLCGYTGPSVRAMYGLAPGQSGAGTTIGIVGAYDSTTLGADINRAAADTRTPGLAAGQYSKVLPDGGFTDEKECDSGSWNVEQTLDVQAAHTIAPAAKLRYYAARSCIGGLYEAFNKAVGDNIVDVISASWGNADGERRMPPATRDLFNQMALQASIQGQSIMVSSGDAGNNSGAVGTPTASFPATSPYVTAVGGTTVGLGQDNKPKVLTGWENSGNTLSGQSWVPQSDADGPFAGGAGGGPSALYDAPEWQQGIVPAGVSNGRRAIPDVSALADSYTGLLIGYTDTSGRYGLSVSGGTSLAAPLMAGLAANAQQARGGAQRGGLLNPALYAVRNNPSVLVDVVPQKAGVWTPRMHALPGAKVPGAAGSYLVDFDARPQNLASGRGWDPVTGVGTPGPGFVSFLAR
ncbi:S53 family peptidase [Amycolatopsis keratiniphila]|uniref:S53 family peptidase n=1 Tax=Amycolatopsis keratiniphila TaxID=129921 RepID=UPI0008793F84|nr:S53 family serine peptidase [Amycolatopsis keratiniphila]SDU66797.1 Subtilase family protein [Amycolatopsis keratiniphila]